MSANWCVLTKIQLQNLTISYFDFYSFEISADSFSILKIFDKPLGESNTDEISEDVCQYFHRWHQVCENEGVKI